MARSFAITCGAILSAGTAWAALAEPAKPSKPPMTPPSAAPAEGKGDLVFQGVQFWHFQGSKLSATATARTLTYDRTAGAGVAAGVDGTLQPSEKQALSVHFQADQTAGVLGARALDATGHVVLARADGTVRTEVARYEGLAHRISGDAPVELQTPELRVRGQAFTLDTETEQIDLLGPVDGRGEGAR